MSSYEETFERFVDFSKKTYVDADAKVYLKKLRKEMIELEEGGDHPDMEEIADCILVLVGLSRFAKGNLKESILSKVALNESRRWKKLSDGTYQHY